MPHRFERATIPVSKIVPAAFGATFQTSNLAGSRKTKTSNLAAPFRMSALAGSRKRKAAKKPAAKNPAKRNKHAPVGLDLGKDEDEDVHSAAQVANQAAQVMLDVAAVLPNTQIPNKDMLLFNGAVQGVKALAKVVRKAKANYDKEYKNMGYKLCKGIDSKDKPFRGHYMKKRLRKCVTGEAMQQRYEIIEKNRREGREWAKKTRAKNKAAKAAKQKAKNKKK